MAKCQSLMIEAQRLNTTSNESSKPMPFGQARSEPIGNSKLKENQSKTKCPENVCQFLKTEAKAQHNQQTPPQLVHTTQGTHDLSIFFSPLVENAPSSKRNRKQFSPPQKMHQQKCQNKRSSPPSKMHMSHDASQQLQEYSQESAKML